MPLGLAGLQLRLSAIAQYFVGSNQINLPAGLYRSSDGANDPQISLVLAATCGCTGIDLGQHGRTRGATAGACLRYEGHSLLQIRAGLLRSVLQTQQSRILLRLPPVAQRANLRLVRHGRLPLSYRSGHLSDRLLRQGAGR